MKETPIPEMDRPTVDREIGATSRYLNETRKKVRTWYSRKRTGRGAGKDFGKALQGTVIRQERRLRELRARRETLELVAKISTAAGGTDALEANHAASVEPSGPSSDDRF